MLLMQRDRQNYVYCGEYIRNSCLELIAYEIGEFDIKGSVAELGVFQGDFARLINAAFPGRKLYLFDTFEGFDDRDVNEGKEKGVADNYQDWSNTSVELVLKKMPYPKDCIVRKGFFPETASGVDDTFSFASIDCDLYAPILAGLRWFYDRLVPGGSLMIHDYNNDEYPGTKQAVREFCAEFGLPYFQMVDAAGSAVITKAR
ncbi:hypothetical protein FACS1894167_08370 [Synergistales bacterium]|nr:hypothetical protein FACS1894167_08370 [Synergistales bacterium]